MNNNFRLRELSEDLNSSSVVDLRILNNQSIVIATSGGLGLLDNSMNLYSFDDSNLPVGGNPALEVYTEEELIIVSETNTDTLFKTFSNSLTFPGHGWDFKKLIAELSNCFLPSE